MRDEKWNEGFRERLVKMDKKRNEEFRGEWVLKKKKSECVRKALAGCLGDRYKTFKHLETNINVPLRVTT